MNDNQLKKNYKLKNAIAVDVNIEITKLQIYNYDKINK